MAQTVQSGAVMEITLYGQLFNQLVMNVLHYRLEGTSAPVDGAIVIDETNSAIRTPGSVWDKWKACMTIEATNLRIRYQWIFPIRYRSITPPVVLEQGSATGTCASANHAVAINKFGELAGRGRTGTMHMFGVPKQDQANGVLAVGAATKFDALGAQLILNLVPRTGLLLEPVLLSRSNPAASQIMNNWLTQQTLRVQRRRTVGVGK